MPSILSQGLRIVVPYFWGVCCAHHACAELPADIRPILEANCFGCHGPDKQKGKLRLDTLSTDLVADRRAAETWHDALDAIQLGEMPPEDEEPLSREDRTKLNAWIRGQIDSALDSGETPNTSPVIRRLNRREYQNTMVELLGVQLDYAADLPPEPPSPDGFLNNGEALPMSALQLEEFLNSARLGLSKAIVEGDAPEMHHHVVTTSTETKWIKGRAISNELGRAEVFVARFEEFPRNGEFLVRVKARHIPAEESDLVPRLRVHLGYRPDAKVTSLEVGQHDVYSTTEAEVIEFRAHIEGFPLPDVGGQSKHPGIAILIDNAFNTGNPIPKKGKNDKSQPIETDVPRIIIEEVEFIGPLSDEWPPDSHTAILHPSNTRDRAYVASVLRNFLRRAWRREVTEAEVEDSLAFYVEMFEETGSFETSIRETLALALISPPFLYLVEPGQDEDAGRALDGFVLASRLSYFL